MSITLIDRLSFCQQLAYGKLSSKYMHLSPLGTYYDYILENSTFLWNLEKKCFLFSHYKNRCLKKETKKERKKKKAKKEGRKTHAK